MVKVVKPLGPSTGETGCVVTLNITASLPLTTILGVPLRIRSLKPIKVNMKRDEIHIAAVATSKMITPDIGYIRLTGFIFQPGYALDEPFAK